MPGAAPIKTNWAATIDSVCEWEPGGRELIESEEGSVRQYFDVAVESGGAFWLASSDGLFRYAPLTWRCPSPARSLVAAVHGLTGDESGRLWFVSGSNLHLLQNERHRAYPLPSAASNSVPVVRALFHLRDGTLLLQVGDQCFQFRPAAGTFTAVRSNRPAGSLQTPGLAQERHLVLPDLE